MNKVSAAYVCSRYFKCRTHCTNICSNKSKTIVFQNALDEITQLSMEEEICNKYFIIIIKVK